jgi:hypothetical protein
MEGLSDSPELLKPEEATHTELHTKLCNLEVENEALKKEVQKLLLALELPEAPDLLKQLKVKRKEAIASLADIEAILEIIEEPLDDTSQGH